MYLLEFLRDNMLCNTPIPDISLHLEQLIIRLRRQPGTMRTWASQLRHAYRQLQIALAHARQDQKPKGSPSSSSTPSKPRSSRRASRETSEELLAKEDADDEDVLERSPKRRSCKHSDSENFLKGLEDLELWDRYEEKLEEALPRELLGWLSLGRVGLSTKLLTQELPPKISSEEILLGKRKNTGASSWRMRRTCRRSWSTCLSSMWVPRLPSTTI